MNIADFLKGFDNILELTSRLREVLEDMRARLPLLAIHPDVTPTVERQLVHSLFTQTETLVIGGLTGGAVATLGWARSGSTWLLVWGVAVLIVLACRLLLVREYRDRRRSLTPRAWAAAFTIGAFTSATIWGAAGLFAFLQSDDFVRFLIVTVIAGVASGAAIRNSAAPAAALGQTILILLPMTLGSLLTHDIYYSCFAVINLVHVAATLKTAAFFGRRTVGMLILNQRFIRANKENKRLLKQVKRINEELEDSNAVLATLSVTDELTGLLNRRGFETRLQREWRRADRARAPLSMLLIDVDHFKAYNDRFGHPAGDKCLRAVGQAIAASVRRPADEVTRYGGEEFAVILPDTDTFGAQDLAEDVRNAILNCRVDLVDPSCEPCGVTASIGVAAITPNANVAVHTLIDWADQALYQAKTSGRNQVYVRDAETSSAVKGLTSQLGLDLESAA